ncbi:MAG: hypothetical protein ACTS1X_05855 [Parasphingopyxis sp.]|uniref:hypothetical protein n=1 Tax=Parasphingopyxis sp. TaxID=1920299 RepID=UPI003F9F24A7
MPVTTTPMLKALAALVFFGGILATAPARASTQAQAEPLSVENWEALVERTFNTRTRGFLVDQGVNYIAFVQDNNRDSWTNANAPQDPWSRDRMRTEVERYFSLVEQPVLAGYHAIVGRNVSNAEVSLALSGISTDNEVAAFACVVALPADDAGELQWNGCETDFEVTFSPAVKDAAARFLNAFNTGIVSRIVNDGFGGATCHAVDRLVDAYTTENFTIELDVNIGIGPGTARACTGLKPRWAALVGYERLMATEEFGE